MSKFRNIALEGRKFTYNLRDLLNPFEWAREFKFEHQRKARGWSDRDTWDTGTYLLEVTSGMLKKLGDAKSHVDWDEYFKTYPNNQGYKSLQQVAKDIDNYLDFEEHSWVDTLGFEIKHSWRKVSDDLSEMVDENTPEEERQIKKALQAHHKEYERRYKKATKAMTFVAVNFPALWD